MLSRFFATLTLTLYAFSSTAQTKPESQFWTQGYLVLPLKNRWSLLADYSDRYSGAFKKEVQWIGRVGVDYKITKSFSAGAGYAYSEFFTAKGVRTENRPWQQLNMQSHWRKLKLMQRLRLEERFQKESTGPRFNYRLRCQLQVQYPILKKERLTFVLADEPMLNFGNQINGNKFDQNRLQVGLQIKIVKNLFLAPSYLSVYQFQASSKTYKNINVLRSGLIYSRAAK